MRKELLLIASLMSVASCGGAQKKAPLSLEHAYLYNTSNFKNEVVYVKHNGTFNVSDKLSAALRKQGITVTSNNKRSTMVAEMTVTKKTNGNEVEVIFYSRTKDGNRTSVKASYVLSDDDMKKNGQEQMEYMVTRISKAH